MTIDCVFLFHMYNVVIFNFVKLIYNSIKKRENQHFMKLLSIVMNNLDRYFS